ncbi:MAG TPA: Bax inhibitor-1 family protein [Actinomycetota bacterium]|jgi:FtsH-binding integral membrane protein|nr:Bax inhibitor-1 family protein [Actinomycetota bacterium]
MANSMPAELRTPVGSLDASSRARFISRTYGHLFAAIAAFTAIEVLLFTTGVAEPMAEAMLSRNWLLVLGGFMIVGYFASWAAARAQSPAAQYAALGAYVLAEAVIFVPLLVMADRFAPGAISSAAVVTLIGFAGLTAIAVSSGKDFSFLGVFLKWGGVVALLLIVGSVLFGFQLGTFFSVAMVAFAGGAILYSTSKILRTYPEDRYVSAALELFGAVALMFWYVLRLFMSRD